jgi:RNA polymerase sigma-70 factor (ECF subfamily)
MTLETERQAAALMRLGQSGNAEAYAALLDLLASVTRAYACGRVGAVLWLDDLVQETLITVHRVRHTYDPRRPFAPWFYAIAASRLVDALRRERRTASREVPSDAAPETARPEGSWHQIDFDAVHAAVAALPVRQRQVIEALKFQDLSVREVASRLRMTESAVKVTAHRAYKALRRLLKGQRP